MIHLESFENLPVRGAFRIVLLEIVEKPLVDSLGREAIARTAIIGREFHITIRTGLTDKELSITLYHEILEAMTVAADNPPESVRMFNEGDFERAAYRAHDELGEASPATIDRMLQSYGFRGK
jgi:hypothetical protein